MAKTSRKRYTKEFKEEAIKLVTELGYSQQKAADSLGIPSKNMNRWVQEKSGIKKIKASEPDTEILALRKQIKRLEQEKEILKKAAAFFASELQ